jgi:hypothetical protein
LLLLLLVALWLGALRLLLIAVAAAATTATAARPLLLSAGLRLLLLLLLRLWLLPLLAALGVRLLSALRARPFALIAPVPLPRPRRTLALAALIAALFRRARTLLPLAQFLLHEAALLRVGSRADLVVSAVRAAFPALGVRLLAVRAEDALRERHVEIGAHCTLRPCLTRRAGRRCRR